MLIGIAVLIAILYFTGVFPRHLKSAMPDLQKVKEISHKRMSLRGKRPLASMH
jgi:hypothetical protein